MVIILKIDAQEKQGSASPTIINFTNVADFDCIFFCTLPFNLSLFFLLLPSHSLPVLFFCTTVDTYIHLSLCRGKKDECFFFPHALCCLWLICPRPVSCVFSPISGILTSPPSMWVTHMCAAGVSCRAGSCSLCELGLLCVCACACGFWVTRVCVYF